MNTPDTEWESIEKIAEEVFKKIQKNDIDVENGLEHSFARETLKHVIKEALSSRDTYWKERVRKEVEGMKKNSNKEAEWYGDDAGWEAQGWNNALDTLLDNLK